MPRAPRLTIKNGCYHIITRGNQKQTVFLDEQDYNEYIHLLKKYKREIKFKIYGYCLMPNHVHLVCEVKEPKELSLLMKKLNLSYSIYFNKKYRKIGHLWQDRFLSRLIYKDLYLLQCINYIEANPVRAQLTTEITKYLWSSYNLHLEQQNGLIDTPKF